MPGRRSTASRKTRNRKKRNTFFLALILRRLPSSLAVADYRGRQEKWGQIRDIERGDLRGRQNGRWGPISWRSRVISYAPRIYTPFPLQPRLSSFSFPQKRKKRTIKSTESLCAVSKEPPLSTSSFRKQMPFLPIPSACRSEGPNMQIVFCSFYSVFRY